MVIPQTVQEQSVFGIPANRLKMTREKNSSEQTPQLRAVPVGEPHQENGNNPPDVVGVPSRKCTKTKEEPEDAFKHVSNMIRMLDEQDQETSLTPPNFRIFLTSREPYQENKNNSRKLKRFAVSEAPGTPSAQVTKRRKGPQKNSEQTPHLIRTAHFDQENEDVPPEFSNITMRKRPGARSKALKPVNSMATTSRIGQNAMSTPPKNPVTLISSNIFVMLLLFLIFIIISFSFKDISYKFFGEP